MGFDCPVSNQHRDEVIAITVSSKLSGTYQSACIAAAEFPGKVKVVDGKNVAIGSAILAEYALRLVDEGFDAKEIAEKLKEEFKLDVDKRKVAVEDIKQFGTFEFEVKLYQGISAKLFVSVGE